MTKYFVRPSLWLLVAFVAVSAAMTSPGTSQAQSATTGRVRVVHASADTPPVDIFVDGQKAVTALAYPNNTGYVALPAGARDVKVFVSPSNGEGAPALQASLTVAAGKDYTVLAVGEVTKSTLALLPLEDNNALPAAGNAHVRLVHASPDAPPVDVVVTGTDTKVFSGVAYKSVGTYTPVPAGTYSLDVKVASSGQTVKTIPGVALGDRGVYTVVATGPAATLQVLALGDVAPTGPHSPASGTGLMDTSGDATGMLIFGGALVSLAAAAVAGSAATVRARRNHSA